MVLRYLEPIATFLRQPRSRHTNDSSAAASINWRRHPVDLPRGLELTWLGTAGFAMRYEGTSLLIEPYLSRAGLATIASRRALHSVPGLVERHIDAADAVLMGHTHFDHAVDVPYITRRFGCKAYGSRSLRHLMGLHRLAHLAVEVEPYRIYSIGPFEVSFIPSRHSKLVLGLAAPYEGELCCEHLEQLTHSAYRCGSVYGIRIVVAGVTFYHLGSADLIDEAVREREVDYLLCAIAGRGFTADLVPRLMRTLSPRVIVPTHHDNFFLPLGGPMGFSFNVNFGGFLEQVTAASRDVALRAFDPLQTIAG